MSGIEFLNRLVRDPRIRWIFLGTLFLVACAILILQVVKQPIRTPGPTRSPWPTSTPQPTRTPLPTPYSLPIPTSLPTRAARPTPTSPPALRVVIVEVVIPLESAFGAGDEYVVLLNPSDRIDMNGWTISDEQGITYMFGNFILNDMSAVRVHSGRGQDTQTDLFWGITSPFWGNRKSGKVVLRDISGAPVDVLAYVTPER